MKYLLIFFLLCTPCWGAVDFNGDADAISVASSESLEDCYRDYNCTTAFWAKATANQSDRRAVSFEGYGGGIDVYIAPFDASSGDGVRVFWRATNVIDENGQTRRDWNHYAFVARANQDFEFYVDGTSIGTSSASVAAANCDDFCIGSVGCESGNYFDGELSEVAVWDTDLSVAEIQLLASSRTKRIPLQVQPSNLLAYYPLDDVSAGSNIAGATFRDLSGNGEHGTGVDADNDSTSTGEQVLSYP